jgi:uncharacterized protein (UPF0147 family)
MLIGNPAIVVIHPGRPCHAQEQNPNTRPTQYGLIGSLHGLNHEGHQLKDGHHSGSFACYWVKSMNIEERLEQVASVINQIDDPKVPRNIRRQAKEACENWLLNKGKKLDVRIAMAQSKLEELYEDPNIPPEFGTLILTINTELERILTEVL